MFAGQRTSTHIDRVYFRMLSFIEINIMNVNLLL